MQDEHLTYKNLTPDCQLDALASIGIYPETGLLALNSYENLNKYASTRNVTIINNTNPSYVEAFVKQ